MGKNIIRGLSALGIVTAASVSSADFFNFSFTAGALTDAVTNYSINTSGASGVIRGYTISGDWVAGGGDPWSQELTSQVSGVSDHGNGDLDRGHGGLADGNNFSFSPSSPTWDGGVTSPDGNDQTSMVDLGAPSLGGTFTLGLYQSFSGSDATLTNASIQFYTDAIAPVSISTVGASTMTNRPSSFTATESGAFRYQATSFTPTASGDFLIQLHTGGIDGYLLAYNGSFDPNNVLTNIIGRDDVGDLGDANSSNMALSLTAGQTYTFVSTVFNPAADISAGTLVIAGATAPVPEPATIAALGLGIAAIARKRRSK